MMERPQRGSDLALTILAQLGGNNKGRMSVQSADDWPELRELRQWLVEDVAPRASTFPTTSRLVTTDGLHWLAKAVQDDKGIVRVSVYWESSDDPARRTHEWDALIEEGNCRVYFE